MSREIQLGDRSRRRLDDLDRYKSIGGPQFDEARWLEELVGGTARSSILVSFGELIAEMEDESSTPYLSWQARARRHRRNRHRSESFKPRGSCDLVVEVLSYPPSHVLPDELTEDLWVMIERYEHHLDADAARSTVPYSEFVSSARAGIAVGFLGGDLGVSRRRHVHGPGLIDQNSRAMWLVTARNLLGSLLAPLDDGQDLPFLWPDTPTSGQLWTPVDKEAEGTGRWVPESAPAEGISEPDVPESAENVPNPD